MEEIIQIQTKFSNVYEFYRDANGKKHMNEIDFENYFYIKNEDIDRALDVLSQESRNNDFDTQVGYTSIYDDKLCKIIPNKFEFWKFRRALKANNIPTFEAWLDVDLKYLMQYPKKFSKNRKVGVIDIETDGSLDCQHTPKAITSICLFNYETGIYSIWVLNNVNKDPIKPRENKNEVLFIFDDEKEMMQHFCETFRSLDFDICGGWNSNNYDWPYIINRLNVLGIQPLELSNFGEVETRGYRNNKGRMNYTSVIRGVDLVDFIPVLQKNTCYSSQPSSFSLASTAQFYLDTPKLVDIGFEAWKTDINSFLDYNVRDVELVKLIIDKFKLIDFLMVIQTEIAPVALDNTTHNSIVLLHYLKHHFRNAIIPDNHGRIIMGKHGFDEVIDLTTSHIRIKAAHVIPAHPGIHDTVSVFDFSGLYPSIIRTFNMCPSTINETEGVKVDDIIMWQIAGSANEDKKGDTKKHIKEWNYTRKFSNRKKGIYPIILEDLTSRRNEHKYKLPELKAKYGKDSSEYLLSLYRSDVLKQISNSLFGVGGFNRFPLFNPWVAAAITSIARKCIIKTEEWLINEYGYEVVTGDTDSVMVKHPKDVDPKKLGEELNTKLKTWILTDFKIPKERYCMDLEYEKTFNIFVMKNAKKKYYGYLNDGSFQAKGFSIIQHVLSDEVKAMIKKIYIMLMEKKPTKDVRDEMLKIKKEFFKLPYEKLAKDLKIAKNLEEYDGDIQHIRGARYANKYLGTDFKGGSTGKLIFIKETTDPIKYPMTDVVLLDEDTKLPDELKLNYDILWEKLFITNIQQLEDIEEMNISRVINPNTELGDFC